MSRSTIDFGIHLGTSYSSIAVLEGTQVQVIKNNDGTEITPCAVYIDKNNNLLVGRAARQRLDSAPEDAYAEFRSHMGTSTQFIFQKSGRVMHSEDLTAEVIKSLRLDVQQHLGEEVDAAVITVPPAFELPQYKATEEAARLAGLQTCRLIMEPIAAAMAYAFQNRVEKDYWLVYDFGGSTFDAFVVQMQDGAFHIVNHAGYYQLGESLVDGEIVDKLLAPAVASLNPLTGFHRDNPKWRKAFAKLQRAVEEAKNRLSKNSSWMFTFDYLCNDDHGEPVVFEYELKRSDVFRLAEPYILRTAQISRQALAEKSLGSGDIAKAIYVGNPAMTSFIRPLLDDPVHGLGLHIEDSIDPLTVCAQGAAIFAGNQSLEGEGVEKETEAGTFYINLQHLPQKEEKPPAKEVSYQLSGIELQIKPLVPIKTILEMPIPPDLVLCQKCQVIVETVIVGDIPYCDNCGVALPALQSQSRRDKMIRITSTETRCPHCMLSIFPVHIGGKYYCSECGINLKV